MEIKPMEPRQRYIAIGGEDWSAALGLDAKYITPKVGIFLHGSNIDLMRREVSNMAFMSANAEMAMYPLLRIMEVMQETFEHHGKLNPKLLGIAHEFRHAIDSAKRTAELIQESRK